MSHHGDRRIADLDAPVRCARCGRFMKVVGYAGEHYDSEPVWRCFNTGHKPQDSSKGATS